jgi:hypothetical protein
MEYKHSAVHHLAWCLFSEPMVLISTTPALTIKPSQTLLNWLAELDNNPKPLHDYLATHNRVLLGSYFECLWQFFFQFRPEWQLLDHHIQLRQEKQTLGELDVLARNTRHNQDYHIELAVKFYLKQPNTSGENFNHWLGPQSHDRLDLKLNKLTLKQLPFLHHPVTQADLSNRHLPTNPQQALALKGYLFEPWQQSKGALHPSINPKATMQSWLHEKHSQTLFAQKSLWVILPKTHWLGPYRHSQEASLQVLTSEAAQQFVQAHFDHSAFPYALMLAQLSTSHELKEQARFMLVHNAWPTQVVKT